MINAQNLQQTVENTRYIRSEIGVRGRNMILCGIQSECTLYVLPFDKSPGRVELPAPKIYIP